MIIYKKREKTTFLKEETVECFSTLGNFFKHLVIYT